MFDFATNLDRLVKAARTNECFAVVAEYRAHELLDGLLLHLEMLLHFETSDEAALYITCLITCLSQKGYGAILH
jgi:hypothetical protein